MFAGLFVLSFVAGILNTFANKQRNAILMFLSAICWFCAALISYAKHGWGQ